MPLTPVQIAELKAAIGAYAFPPTYFDFVTGVPVHAANMLAVEAAIGGMLSSPNPVTAKNGLANVLYWGYAQMGIGPTRVSRFNTGVTSAQIAQFQAILRAPAMPTLIQIRNLKMPEFSGVSFISKVLTFIDPANYCVLDLQLSRLGLGPRVKAIHGLVYTTTIGTTVHNQRVYDSWRQECAGISHAYYGGAYRVVDVERGFFHLIQTGRLPLAQQIYADA